MYRFGICWYDESLIFYNDGNNDVDNIICVYNKHKDAYRKYLEIIKDYGYAPQDLWIAWINDENKVIQFERVKSDIYSRIRSVKNIDKL